MTLTHFTAWLCIEPSYLDQPNMDISVLEDKAIAASGSNGEIQEDDWATDAGKPVAFRAVTSVNAKDGDVDKAIAEAQLLMENAGWTIVGDWDSTDNAYIVTVEKESWLMDTIRPDALAECGDDELDSRPGVQETTANMILQYVIVSGALPRESAEPFAVYMNENWLDYNEDGDATVGQVIEGGLSYWRGQ